jgi:ankyrin repeat protein
MALHNAARNGDLEAGKKLLAEGANINEKDKHSRTPLHLAAW